MNSLREQCKQRLKVAFDSVRVVSNTLNFILVVDNFALKVLSNTIKMMELINYGITIVEKLQLKRKKYNKIEAVYLVHPQSITTLIQDFPDNEKPQYRSVHILTLSKISKDIMSQLSQAANLARRIKTLKEINFNFCLHGPNEVKLCSYKQNSFQKSLEANSQFVANTVEELSTILTTLSSFYVVQIYYQKSEVSTFTQKIALGLKEKFQSLFKTFNQSSIPNYTNSAPLTTFLILDRSYDPVSPLIRDYHYGPLFYDIKNISNHKITDFGKQKKTLNLNENDEILQKYKNHHISSALKGIPKDFQDFCQSHSAAKFHKGEEGDLNLGKLTDVMKKMPQYIDIKDRYTLHYQALQQILGKMEDLDLKEQGLLQQSLISSMSQDGRKIKEKDLLQNLIKRLDKTSDQREKAKLVVIGLLCLEIKEKQQKSLTNYLKNTNYQDIEKKLNQISTPSAYHLNQKKEVKGNQILNRHQTMIEQIVKEISNQGHGNLKILRVGAADKFSKSATKNAPSLGLKKIRVETNKTDKPRLIVFYNSALGYNEIRSLSQFQSTYNLIFVSHNFVTPGQYIDLINKSGLMASEEQDQLEL